MHTTRLLTRPTVSEHLGCFHVLANVNKAAMNWSIQSSLWDFVFRSSGYAPRRGSAGSYSYCFLFLRRYYCFYSNHALCIPTISVQGPRSLHVLTDRSGLTAAAWWVWGAASRVLAVASAPLVRLWTLVYLLWRNVHSSPLLLSESR